MRESIPRDMRVGAKSAIEDRERERGEHKRLQQMNSASVLFEMPAPAGTGGIIYLAYDFQGPDSGSMYALMTATIYADFVKH